SGHVPVGTDRRRRRPPQGSRGTLTAAARVVPAVPTFAVDSGFWYSIPDSHRPRVEVGSIVRVPLGGRRVRGYVVELADRPPDRLKPIGGVSGDLPVFGPKLRDALIWAAHHYVAPVSVALERAAPPNLPSRPAGKGPTDSHPVSPPAQLSEWSEATSRRHRRPVTALITSWEDTGWIG